MPPPPISGISGIPTAMGGPMNAGSCSPVLEPETSNSGQTDSSGAWMAGFTLRMAAVTARCESPESRERLDFHSWTGLPIES